METVKAKKQPADLRAMLDQRAALARQMAELRDAKRELEWRVAAELVQRGRLDCLRVDWDRLARMPD